MKLNFIPFLLVCLLLTACVGLSAPQDAAQGVSRDAAQLAFFNTVPTGNELVFIGTAGRMSNPKDSLRLALEDAARQVAKFDRVTGEFAAENVVGGSTLDFVQNTHTALCFDEEDSTRFLDALRYDADTDTMVINNTFFVRTTLPGALPVPISFRPTHSGRHNRPCWVDNPPTEIDGLLVGVGFSNRRALMADTYRNSRNNAIFAIVRNINTVSHATDIHLYDGTMFGRVTTTRSETHSFATLRAFYVLDTWINPANRTVWTLAIAKNFNVSN